VEDAIKKLTLAGSEEEEEARSEMEGEGRKSEPSEE
jgi:hypothetical protein